MKAWPPSIDPEGRNRTDRPVAAIQSLVGALPDGEWGSATTAKVTAWQDSQKLDADGIWGLGSDGRGFPANPAWEGCDYSFARPDIVTLRALGLTHVGRYLWPNSKGLTRPEYDALRDAGMDVWLIYEEDGRELTGGFAAGVRVAQKAEALRKDLGTGLRPIYFNVDFDAPDAQIALILDALRGISSVIGRERTGLYAGYRVLKAAFDANAITWGFQTYAWSGGRWDSRAHLQQYCNGQWGDRIDFTRAIKAEFGQHDVGTR